MVMSQTPRHTLLKTLPGGLGNENVTKGSGFAHGES